MPRAKITTDDGPGCGHALCLFERDCVVIQAEQELADHRADRAQRRVVGLAYAHALGLGDDEGELLEVILYSSDLSCRIAAGQLLVAALQRIATSEAA